MEQPTILDIRFTCPSCGIRQQVTEQDVDIFGAYALIGTESRGSFGIAIGCPNPNCEGVIQHIFEEWVRDTEEEDD